MRIVFIFLAVLSFLFAIGFLVRSASQDGGGYAAASAVFWLTAVVALRALKGSP